MIHCLGRRAEGRNQGYGSGEEHGLYPERGAAFVFRPLGQARAKGREQQVEVSNWLDRVAAARRSKKRLMVVDQGIDYCPRLCAS
jgi:hypothetical protein